MVKDIAKVLSGPRKTLRRRLSEWLQSGIVNIVFYN